MAFGARGIKSTLNSFNYAVFKCRVNRTFVYPVSPPSLNECTCLNEVLSIFNGRLV